MRATSHSVRGAQSKHHPSRSQTAEYYVRQESKHLSY
jgi:hypothetical protein